jgi:phosphoribosyl-dephospho-CoA transferase
VETVGLVGGLCLGANGKGQQLEVPPRQCLYCDKSSAAIPARGQFSTCTVEGLGIEMRD